MRMNSWSLFACLAFASGCADSVSPSDTEGETASAVSTTGDTDLAAECGGVLDFVNQASFTRLDEYLPSNVAQGLVNRRAVAPFTSIADISSVSGIADLRLRQIFQGARIEHYVDDGCAGVFQELAISVDDQSAILTFLNTATTEQIIDALRLPTAETVGPQLVARRPFQYITDVADAPNIGPSSFRGIRDAAVVGPFDQLVNAVNATPSEVWIRTGFEPIEAMYPEVYGRQSSFVCFGMPSAIVTQAGGTNRPNLATGADVLAAVTNAVQSAGSLPISSAPGLADLQAQVAGQTFYGCEGIGYEPNPWCGKNRSFYINSVTGYRVFVETGWCE